LIKYETLDSEQIDDIMTGREPREPRDWSSDQEFPPSGSVKGDSEKGRSSVEGKLGSPAQQH
jgi:cell division protease FtsH